MARIPLLPDGGLNPAQKAIYDKIASGPRGMVIGPMRAALHSPELADRWQSLGEFLRYNSSIEPRLSELAIIACGRYWNSDVEWYVHADAAVRCGLAEAVVLAIRSSFAPAFEHPDEAAVYEFSRQLLAKGRVCDTAYSDARELLGDIGVVELTALVGYYTMVSMTLNAHHVPLPDPDPPVLRTLDAAVAAPDGGPTPLGAAMRGEGALPRLKA